MRRLALLFGLMSVMPATAREASDVLREAETNLQSCASTLPSQDRQWCEFSRQQFPVAFVAARQGDYQAQRNLAFMLSRGGDGAVKVDRIESCAWRMIVVSTQAQKADSTDTSNLQTDCGRLPQTLQVTAQARAGQLLQEIGQGVSTQGPPPVGPRGRVLDGTARPLGSP